MLSFIDWIPSKIEPWIYNFKLKIKSKLHTRQINFKLKRNFHHGTLWIIWGNKNQCLRKAPFNNFCILWFLFCLFPKPGTGEFFRYKSQMTSGSDVFLVLQGCSNVQKRCGDAPNRVNLSAKKMWRRVSRVPLCCYSHVIRHFST